MFYQRNGCKFIYVVTGNAYSLEELELAVSRICSSAMIEWTIKMESLASRGKASAMRIITDSKGLPSTLFLRLCPTDLYAALTYRVGGDTIAMVKYAGVQTFSNGEDASDAYDSFVREEARYLYAPGEYGIPDDICDNYYHS